MAKCPYCSVERPNRQLFGHMWAFHREEMLKVRQKTLDHPDSLGATVETRPLRPEDAVEQAAGMSKPTMARTQSLPHPASIPLPKPWLESRPRHWSFKAALLEIGEGVLKVGPIQIDRG